jgi:hypothetical protein
MISSFETVGFGGGIQIVHARAEPSPAERLGVDRLRELGTKKALIHA